MTDKRQVASAPMAAPMVHRLLAPLVAATALVACGGAADEPAAPSSEAVADDVALDGVRVDVRRDPG